jgi:hypothetical protein
MHSASIRFEWLAAASVFAGVAVLVLLIVLVWRARRSRAAVIPTTVQAHYRFE